MTNKKPCKTCEHYEPNKNCIYNTKEHPCDGCIWFEIGDEKVNNYKKCTK